MLATPPSPAPAKPKFPPGNSGLAVLPHLSTGVPLLGGRPCPAAQPLPGAAVSLVRSCPLKREGKGCREWKVCCEATYQAREVGRDGGAPF